ncbi:hypothetical protein ACFWP3_10270 [Streptomyces sp. NPDC058525]
MTKNNMDQQSAIEQSAQAGSESAATPEKASISSRISKYGKYDRLEG